MRRKGIYNEDVKDIAKQLGMPANKCHEMIVAQFDFMRYVIQRGDFEGVRLAYIGKFAVSEYLLKKINDKGDGTVPIGKRSGSTG